MTTGSSAISRDQRNLWLLAIVFFGVLPVFLFFIWVERNLTLPWIQKSFEWPWITLGEDSPGVQASFDFTCALALSFLRARLTRFSPPSRSPVARRFPPRLQRGVAWVTTGLCIIALMAIWQNTGVVLWVLPAFPKWLNGLSLMTFWVLMALAASKALPDLAREQNRRDGKADLLSFFGFRQLLWENSPSPERTGHSAPALMTTPFRHVSVQLMLAAFLLTPLMTLDRLILTGAVCLFLLIRSRLLR